MKRLFIVMCVICMGFSGMAYAEEGQNVQKAPTQTVVQQAPAQSSPAADTQAPKAPEQPVLKVQETEAPAVVPAQKVQAKPDTMPEIVVTATKTKQEARKAPTKVEVVKAAQISDTNVTTVDQALKGIPGVFSARKEGPAGLTDPRTGLTLRGMPNKSQTLVLLDGQRLNNYEGTVLWWTIPPEAIERIEVVKGPFSSLYGGGAMGGVVNIITKTDYVPLQFSLAKGSYDLTEMSVGSGARIKDFAYHIMYNRTTVGEIEQAHRYRGNSNSPAIEVVPTATGSTQKIDGQNTWLTTIDALEMGFDWDMSPDSTLGLKVGNASFVWEPQKNLNVLGADITSNLRENGSRHLNLTYNTTLTKYADLKFNAGVVDNYQDLFQMSPTNGDSTCPNSAYNMGLQSNINLPFHNTLSVGLDSSKARMISEDYTTPATPQLTQGKVLSAGAFLQDEFKATDFLILYAGARYDYWKAFDAKNNAPGGDDVSDRTRNHVSPKGSIVVLPDDKTSIRATVGESFRAPVPNEMYSSRWVPSTNAHSLPNLALKPETALTYEGNIERIFFDRLTLGATYFSNHMDDMIYSVTLNSTDKQNQNIAKAYSKGYELSINYKVIDGLTLFANQTHTDTRISEDDRTTGSLEGKVFKNTPKNIFNYGCDVKYAGFFGNVLVQTVSDQYYNDDNSDIYDHAYGGYDRYTTGDVTVGYKFLKNSSLSLSVNNIGDRKYWENNDRNPGRTYMVKGTASF